MLNNAYKDHVAFQYNFQKKKKIYTPHQHTSSGTVAVKIQRYKILAYDAVICQREQ